MIRTDYGFDVFVLFGGELSRLGKIEEGAGAEGEGEGFVEVGEVVVDLGRDEGGELAGGEGGILGEGFPRAQHVVSEMLDRGWEREVETDTLTSCSAT